MHQARIQRIRWIVIVVVAALVTIAVGSIVNAAGSASPTNPDQSVMSTVVSATTTRPTLPGVYEVEVSCPPGFTATGGGAQLIDAKGTPNSGGGMLTGSSPVGDPPIGWLASASTAAFAPATGPAAGLKVYAVCSRHQSGPAPTPTPAVTATPRPTSTPFGTPSPSPTVIVRSPTATPTASASMSISPANQNLAVGDIFSVDVVLDVGSLESRGAQAGLTFDPSVVHLTGVSEGTFYKSWAAANGAQTSFIAPLIDNVAGTMNVGGDAIVGGTSNQGPSGSGSLFTITGQAVGNGSSPLILNGVVVSDDNGRSFGHVALSPGIVSVGTGTPTPAPGPLHVTAP